MIDLLLTGALGVMGGMVRDAVEKTDDIRIVAGVDIRESDELPFPVYPSLDDVKESPAIVLDFSHFSALESVLDYCLAHKLPVIICATGHTAQQKECIYAAAKEIPVFFSANMSLGVNLLKELSCEAAGVLESGFDIEILEKHHNRKIDAPSGTAVMLADAINDAINTPKEYVYERQSKHERRKPTEMGIHSIRGGTTVGEHSVLFYGNDEVIELTHIANSRQVFATGAIRAVRYLTRQGVGLYAMDNLLAEEQSVTEITALPHQTLFNIAGKLNPTAFLQVFQVIAKEGIPIDVITYSFSGVISHLGFSAENRYSSSIAGLIGPILEASGLSLDLMADLCKVTVKGTGMRYEAGVGARVFEALIGGGIVPLSVTTSEEKISVMVLPKLADKAKEILSELI